MKKDLIKSFNKATKKINEPILKVCSYCKEPTEDWIATIRWNNGECLLNKVMCGKCQEKRK